ncbi:MAG: general secretion pathway protein GspK [Deltaproteobacteria bacterium]|nr:general secretion pathway protein GspK [Deltaproteobacteria bacterium]
MKRILKNERGIALFIVLWVMALLTVIAGEFCYAIRTEANITRNFKEETQTYYIAVSGLFWAIEELVVNEFVPLKVNAADVEEEQEDIRLRINTDIPAVPYGDGQFKVLSENESGKVNLNRAGEFLLKMMLNHFEIADADKNIIVDSIMDWRDKDHFYRANGAENEYYLSLPKPYPCKNGDFTSIGELLLVRGVTSEIFYGGLKDMVTVYQDQETGSERDYQRPERDSRQKAGFDFNRININAAPPQMLRAFPLMTEDVVLDIRKYREKKDFRSFSDVQRIVGSDKYAAIWPYITFSLSPYYTIKSVGMLKDSRTRQGVQAVVKIDKTLTKGYEIIQWIDGLEYRS